MINYLKKKLNNNEDKLFTERRNIFKFILKNHVKRE